MILRQPLRVKDQNTQGRRVIPFHHSSITTWKSTWWVCPMPKYSTSVTKTKAADYGHIKWIEDLVPISMWSQTIVKYDRSALWGISHWGKKRRQFYAFATSRESARDAHSKREMLSQKTILDQRDKATREPDIPAIDKKAKDKEDKEEFWRNFGPGDTLRGSSEENKFTMEDGNPAWSISIKLMIQCFTEILSSRILSQIEYNLITGPNPTDSKGRMSQRGVQFENRMTG
ncbi:hypothetical protein Tco_0728199 [Tanacetum coccineum]|uniref:Uncharacterized protein n=1 Tax=Tanacetum coccineum TaxID=301880 RepID=A0ABQ4YNI9_9ASTR